MAKAYQRLLDQNSDITTTTFLLSPTEAALKLSRVKYGVFFRPLLNQTLKSVKDPQPGASVQAASAIARLVF